MHCKGTINIWGRLVDSDFDADTEMVCFSQKCEDNTVDLHVLTKVPAGRK